MSKIIMVYTVNPPKTSQIFGKPLSWIWSQLSVI